MNKTKGVLFSVLSAVLFGLVSSLSPLAYEGGFNPVTLALMRQAFNLPVALAVMLCTKTSLSLQKGQPLKLAALGIVGWAATTLLLNTALSLIDVGIASTIHFTYPIFVTLGCVLIYRIKISRAKIMALSVSTIGIVTFVLGGTSSGGGSTLGVLLAVLSGVTYAFYMLFLDKSDLAAQMSPIKVNFYVGLGGCSLFLVYGLFTGQLHLSGIAPSAWLLVMLMGVTGGVVAFSMVQLGIKYTDATTTAICSTCEPVTSVIFGTLFLGEELTPLKVIASLLIIAGVLMLSLIPEKKQPVSTEQQ